MGWGRFRGQGVNDTGVREILHKLWSMYLFLLLKHSATPAPTPVGLLTGVGPGLHELPVLSGNNG